MEAKKNLEEALLTLTENLKSSNHGTDEYYRLTSDITNIYNMIERMERIEIEKSKLDEELRASEQVALMAKKKDRTGTILTCVGHGVSVVSVLAPIVFYSNYMKKGFKFEETGTITSPTFKNLISNFKPKK